MDAAIAEQEQVVDWKIPLTGEGEEFQEIQLRPGDPLFVVGANGCGKSALVQHLAKNTRSVPIKKISAHRQTWFESGALSLTAQKRIQVDENLKNTDRQEESRWKDQQASQRLASVLYDLVAAENLRNRKIAQFVDARDPDGAGAVAENERSPFDRINELLRLGTLTVQLLPYDSTEILVRHGSGDPFSVAKMSDGERNAVILAADILTAKPNTLLLIDEPERHLHRSIIVPLLAALFAERDDCFFLISTHEIELPLARPGARVLLPRDCQWLNEIPQSWTVDLLEGKDRLPEGVKSAVLGARRCILFVEGKLESLDLPLYSALFPDVSVVSVGSCEEVRRAVLGLRNSDDHHWVSAFGLIDSDDRNAVQLTKLLDQGVFALDVHSVEALYFCQEARTAVAASQADALGLDSLVLLAEAEAAALECLSKNNHPERLSARRCGRLVQDAIRAETPSWKLLRDGNDDPIQINVNSPYPDELVRCGKMLENRDLDGIISRYPVRETEALHAIASKMRFVSAGDYERAMLRRLEIDPELKEALRGKMGALTTAIFEKPVVDQAIDAAPEEADTTEIYEEIAE